MGGVFFFAVPPNLFSGLHIPDPIYGSHFHTFGRNIQVQSPASLL